MKPLLDILETLIANSDGDRLSIEQKGLKQELERLHAKLTEEPDSKLDFEEIADHLFISLATVKRHIANAYGKLGVSHRTEAVARANELNLL